MKKPRPARPEALGFRGSEPLRRFGPRAAVASAAAAVVIGVAASQFPQGVVRSPDPGPAAPRVAAPSPPRYEPNVLSPSAETLAGVVARRYRIALASAREVVGTAVNEGRRNGLDPVLILAVIAVESRFNPIAESEQGAVGLMQIMPRLHADKLAELGARSALSPHANIAVGARILRESIRRGGGEAAGLQLYNGAPDDDTRAYANRVQAERQRLEKALPRARDHA
jgi:soluble lytic murein transglycosylase-like protein